jgi:Sulfotransferase family
MGMPGDREDLGYVFIMTYGRSGSTLVQGLLNAIPGYLIRGENSAALNHLHGFHKTMLEESQRGNLVNRRKVTHPFYGMPDFPPEQSLRDVRRLVLDTVLRPEPETRVTGFKEIRWYQEDLADYCDWLRQVFPGARFVVNTRNQADVLQSKWWAKKDNTAYLAGIEERILAVAHGLGDAAHHVHYDDYIADPAVLRGLYDWLGEEFDLASVRATLGVRHSV